MSTAVAVRENGAAFVRQDEPAVALAQAMTFEQIVYMGEQLVRTGFLPEHIKTGAQAAAIIMTGQELGMKPMRAIRSLQLVKGKVVESADSQLARFKLDGGHAAFRRLDEEAAVLFLRHPNGDEHEESFTVDDAQAAGLLGKDMYGKFRKAMLRSRAITAGLKSIGWEGGVGNYDPSEALAFSGSTSLAGTPRAATAEPEIVATIEWALAYPLPGKPTAWNGNGGKPLGELSPSMIPGIRSWIDGKIREFEAKEEEAPPVHYELRKACDLILTMRKAEAEKDQVKMFDTASTGSGEKPENPTKLAPGKVEDALDTRTTARPATAAPAAPAAAPSIAAPSIAALTKRMNKLLQHEKLTKAEREDFLTRADAAKSIDDLQRLVIELEEVVASPI